MGRQRLQCVQYESDGLTPQGDEDDSDWSPGSNVSSESDNDGPIVLPEEEIIQRDARVQDDMHDDESSVDESDLDDLLLGVALENASNGVESSFANATAAILRRRKKKKKKRRRTKPYSLKPRKKSRRKTAATPSQMTPEMDKLMQEATEAYLFRDCKKAVEILDEIVRQAPGLHDPFHMLGLIHEEEFKNRKKAIDYYMVAAHLVPGDAALWRRIGVMSQELGLSDQAIYCFRRCVRNASPGSVDEDAGFDLALCYIAKKDYVHAANHLRWVFEKHKGDAFLGSELARCYHHIGKSLSAISVLEICVIAGIYSAKLPILIKNDFSIPLEEIVKTVNTKYYNSQKTTDNPHPACTLYDCIDLNCLNMLCELYLGSRSYEKCLNLLRFIFQNGDLETFPIDLVVKLAVAEINIGQLTTGEKAEQLLAEADNLVEYCDLYLLLADAFYNRGLYTHAVRYFKAVQNVDSVATDVGVWMKVAQCYINTGNLQEAAALLQRCIEANDSLRERSAGTSDAEARLMLSDVLTALGRQNDADQVLLSVSYRDLREADTLPRALPNDQRERLLFMILKRFRDFGMQSPLGDTLVHQICNHQTLRYQSDIGSNKGKLLIEKIKDQADAVTDTSKRNDQEKSELMDLFILVVRDSELDTQRVFRQSFHKKVQVSKNTPHQLYPLQSNIHGVRAAQPIDNGDCETDLVSTVASATGDSSDPGALPLLNFRYNSIERRKDPAKSIQNSKVKAELGLQSVEDILGWLNYGVLLEKGVYLMRINNRTKDAVELLETVICNKKQDRSLLMHPFKKLFRELVEALSFHLSVASGLHRVCLSYLRNRFLREPDDGAFQFYCRILFTGNLAQQCFKSLSASADKEVILENRSWIIRQLLQNPHNYALTLLVGHFCTLSGRWPLAVAEYTRAYQLKSHDALTCLCLAVAYLNLSTSRVVQDRHAVVLRGFSLLNKYMILRAKEVEAEQEIIKTPETCAGYTFKEVKAKICITECVYNLARGYHQLGLTYLAAPLYFQTLKSLSDCKLVFDKNVPKRPALSEQSANFLFDEEDDDFEELVTHCQCPIGTANVRTGSISKVAANLLMLDHKELRLSAAFNLASILNTQGSLEHARNLCNRNITWSL